MSALPILLLLAALCLGAGIGMREPSPPDEPRFVLAARHMVESGDWLVPKRGREFYAEKPPVFIWLQASAQAIVQDWRIAFLLPSLLAALGTLWLTWDLAARLWSRRIAPYAAGALWVSLQFGLQAKRGQIDMVLVLLTTLSLWGLLRHLLRGPSWGCLWLGAFAAGLGTVTKGVGFLPLVVLLPWAFLPRVTPTSDAPARTTAWNWVVAGIAFIAGTAVWLGPLLIALVLDGDPALQAYAHELLFRQTAQRYANAWHHVQPAWYYLQVIATLWLPGALLLPWLVPAWIRGLRRGDARFLLLIGWCLLVLLFFTASPGKREVYLFPALPALCLAAGPLLPGVLRRSGVQRVLLAYLLVVAFVLLGTGSFALLDTAGWVQRLAEQRAIEPTEVRALLWWLVALGAAGVALAAWGRLRRSALALAAFTGAMWLVYGVGISPALDASSSGSALMRGIDAHIGPQAELGVVAWREQHVLQAGRPVTDFGFKQPWHLQWREAQTWLAGAPERRWLLVLDEASSPCIRATDVVAIGRSNRRDWLLVPGTALRPGCATPPFHAQIESE